ncbi:MAG: LicD family protein [Bacteroidales bacterium]|nr:LicD family protein [Bacteroidales bacterium]
MEDFSCYNGEGTILRKVQLRILDIMVEVDSICRKHDIKYWLDGGTLLGAVRHKGFIPWDDDLDICMMQEDYERFIEIASKELPPHLMLQLPEFDPDYNFNLCKVRDKNSFIITQFDDFTKTMERGLYIDIFNVRPYPKVPKKILKPLMKWLAKTDFFFRIRQEVTLKNFVATFTFPVINVCLRGIWSIMCLKPKTKIGKDKTYNGYGTYYEPSDTFPITDIDFEGKRLMSPKNPDGVLKAIFGNYMIIPPKEERQNHIIHVDFY